MAETDVNILYDVPFNRYVGGEAAIYFGSEESLAQRIEQADQMADEKRWEYGKKAKKRMIEKYSWKYIVDEYNRVFHKNIEK